LLGTNHTFEPLEPRQLLAAQLVKDLAPGSADTNPTDVTIVGQQLFFSGNDYQQTHLGLYRSDGTAAGTGLVQAFSEAPRELTNVSGKLFFIAPSPAGGEGL